MSKDLINGEASIPCIWHGMTVTLEQGVEEGPSLPRGLICFMVTLVDIVVMQNSWKYFLYYSVQNSWASSLTTKLLKRMCNERRLKKRRMCCKFFIKILYSSSWLIAFFQASKILNTSWAHERHQTNTLLFKHIPFLHTSKILYLSINNCTLILFPR